MSFCPALPVLLIDLTVLITRSHIHVFHVTDLYSALHTYDAGHTTHISPFAQISQLPVRFGFRCRLWYVSFRLLQWYSHGRFWKIFHAGVLRVRRSPPRRWRGESGLPFQTKISGFDHTRGFLLRSFQVQIP